MNMASKPRAIAILAAVASISAAFWTGVLKPEMPTSSDAAEYVGIARNIITHGVYGLGDPPAPTAFREPGYPLFLAALFAVSGGAALAGLLIAQTALIAAGAWLACRLGLETYRRSAVPAWVAGFATAAHPILAQYAGLFLSEILHLALLMAALLATVRAVERPDLRRTCLAGFFWAALVMTRLTWLFFPPLVAAWFMIRATGRGDRLRIALIAIIPIAISAAWLARNVASTGQWTLSPRSGVNVYPRAVRVTLEPEDRAAYWRSVFIGTAFEKRNHPSFDYWRVSGWVAHWEINERLISEGMAADERDRNETDEAVRIAAKHPVRFALSGIPEIWKLFSPMTFTGPSWFTFQEHADSPRFGWMAAFLFILRAGQLLFMAAVLYGSIVIMKAGSGSGGSLAVTALAYHVIILSLFEAQPRYMIPLWPIAFLLAAAACYDVWRRRWLKHHEP